MPLPVLPIDYTNLGFDSLREAMLTLARENMPEWTDFSASDLGVQLVDLVAYASDITLYYQTRIANNLLPYSSDEPDALIQLLRFIGYELQPPSPATVNLRLAFDAAEVLPVVVPAATQFSVSVASGQQIVFETPRELSIADPQLEAADVRNLRWTKRLFPVPAVEGKTVFDESVAVSDRSPGQRHALRQKPVIAGSIEVRVQEPGLSAPGVTYREVPSLAASTPADRDFVAQRDGAGAVTLVFGDSLSGVIPRGTIRARYRVGGGAQGNIPAGSRFVASLPSIKEAANEQAASGGTPGESLARARSFAPRLLRTQERAVTLQDYVDLALQVPGVGKARAVALSWNRVVLHIAPAGQVAEPSELLKRDLLAFFESRRMAATVLTIVGPVPADIYLGAVIRAQPYFLRSDVRAAVQRAVAGYLAFENVEFGQPVFLSKVYDAIQSLEEVASLTVFKFSSQPGLPATILTQPEVDADGIIQLEPDQLPRPGYRDNPATPPNPAGLPLNSTPRPSIYTIIEGGAGP